MTEPCDHRFTNQPLLKRDFCVRCGQPKPFVDARSRIAALEAVIEKVREQAEKAKRSDNLSRWGEHGKHFQAADTLRILESAPSTVLDQMIREAKAEAWEKGFSAAEEDVDEHNRTSWSAPCVVTNPYRLGEEGHV